MRDFRIPSFRRVDLGYARDSAPAPPKFHHVFISYTTREEEYKQVQEFSEVVVEELKRRGLKRDIAEFIWLDKLELSIDHRYRGKKEIDLYRGEEELEKALRGGLDASRKFLAFVSPEYAKSKWCQFEYEYAIRHLPILDIIWKGPSPVRKWWNARVGVLDARPCFSTERLTEPRGLIWQTGSESWQDKAIRGFKDRLYEYMLFRALVDLIYNFIVEDDVFDIPPEASALFDPSILAP